MRRHARAPTCRDIADVDALIAPLRLPVAGVHGLTRRDIRHWVAHTGGPKVLEAFEDRGRLQDAQRRLHAGEADLDIEYRIVRPDGSLRSLLSQGRLIIDGAGRPRS